MPAFLRNVVVFLAFGGALLASGPASAVIRRVPAVYPTIAAALAVAQPGDLVLVSCGIYSEHDLVVPAGVTIRGATGDPSCVTVDGGGAGRLFDCATVTGVRFEGLTLQGGTAPPGDLFARAGGAIRADSAEVTIQDCVLRDNHASFGAGLAARASALTIIACRFEADSATSATQWAAGGGIWAQRCTGTVQGCVFERNAAFGANPPGDGGAIFAQTSELAISDATFSDNAAGIGAGALYCFLGDRTSVVRCSFSGNRSAAGGAVYVEGSSPTIVQCSFDANVSSGGGGAMFFGELSRPRLEDCTFDGNVATSFAGGAVDCWQSNPVFLRCRFRGGVAGTRGGALAAHGASVFSLTDCLLDGNSAAVTGGALWTEDTARGTVAGTTIRGSASGVSGAAIAATEQSRLDVSASIVAFSTTGAAAACSSSAQITLDCSDVFGNPGGDWTGCLAGQIGASGNFSADPLFCASGAEASVTLPDSPCLAANAPCGVRVGLAEGGCGCPAGATVLVPEDYPTIAAALAAAAPGDVVGVCSGEWSGSLDLPSGVHLVGVRADLAWVVPDPGSPGAAVLRAVHVSDSTVIADLGLDGRGLVPQVVLAESLSTGLRLARDIVTGGVSWGVVNGPDSHVRIGGSLDAANDLYGNGGVPPHQVRNDNVAADSLDATHNWWGTQAYDQILAMVQGKVRTCPITNAAHDAALCAPLSAVDAPRTAALPATVLSVAPNPARGDLRVVFAVRPGHRATLRLYDVAGRRVRTLFAGPVPSGGGEIAWDCRDSDGRSVAPGVYFVHLEVGGDRITRKVVILR